MEQTNFLEQILSFKSRPKFKDLPHPEMQTGTHANLFKITYEKKAEGHLLEQGRLLGSMRIHMYKL